MLPLVNMASIRATLGRLFSGGTKYQDLPEDVCAICYEALGSPDLANISTATVAIRTPYETNCGHVFCYYCLRSNMLSNSSFPCPRCGTTIVDIAKAIPRVADGEDKGEDGKVDEKAEAEALKEIQ